MPVAGEEHLDAGKNYSEEGLPQTHDREAFRANDFYSSLGDWELSFVSTPNKARTPLTTGDEVEIASAMYQKYASLAQEYYEKEMKEEAIQEGNIYENLGK